MGTAAIFLPDTGLYVKNMEIGVRYDVDCSTEHPVSHGVLVLTDSGGAVCDPAG